jgi:hypothetical protein
MTHDPGNSATAAQASWLWTATARRLGGRHAQEWWV